MYNLGHAHIFHELLLIFDVTQLKCISFDILKIYNSHSQPLIICLKFSESHHLSPLLIDINITKLLSQML